MKLCDVKNLERNIWKSIMTGNLRRRSNPGGKDAGPKTVITSFRALLHGKKKKKI